MTKTTLTAFAAPIAELPAAAEAGAWVQLCPAGTFSARDGRGPFDAGHAAALQAIVDRSRQIAGSTELVIDYDHQSVFGARDGVGGTAKAAGWVKEFQVRADGIWGRIEWTAAAAEAIRAKEYRYLSPVLISAKSTGKVLAIRMAALTNTPALDLAQVAASAAFSIDEPSEEGASMDKILAALGLAAGSGEDAVLSAINKLLTANTAVALAAGLQEGATSEEVIAAFGEKAAKPDPAQFVPLSAVTDLQNQVKALETALSADRADAAVEAAIKEGKVAPALKDWALSYAKKDLQGFSAYVAGSPVLTRSQITPKVERKAGDPPLLDPSQAEVAKALGLDAAEYAKTLAAEAAETETL